MARRRQPFVFPTDSETVRNRTQLPANAELDAGRKYQQYARDYLNEDFSYECYQFIANICRSVENSSLRGDFPVRSILIAISKKLLLNYLEFLFLSCLLDELKWPILDETIKNHANTLQNLCPGLAEGPEHKCMYLYLLLAAYSVKVYLNEDIKIFYGEMNNLLPKFQQIFQTWGTKFARTALIINPKKLNAKYNEFSSVHDEKYVHHEDLNSKVIELLKNAPSLEGPRRPRKANNQQSSHDVTPQYSASQQHKHIEEENLPPPAPLQSQLSLEQQRLINEMPPLPWPTTGDSYFGSFQRQNSLDFWNIAHNPPGLSRMDSNGSEFNLSTIKLQPSTMNDRDLPPPQP